MSSKRHLSKGKRINPHFWVFCEGKTEEAYIRFLRTEYRLPVEIIPKIVGCDISSRYIRSFKKGKPKHEKDKVFSDLRCRCLRSVRKIKANTWSNPHCK